MDTRLISVEHDAVTAALTAIDQGIDLIEFGLDHLEAQARVLRSGWDGEARRAFDDAHVQWDASMRRLNAIAAAMSRVARSSNSRFFEQDRREAEAWRV